LAITTEFTFNDQLLTECKSHIKTFASTRNSNSYHFGWSMGMVALAAACMTLAVKRRRQLAAAVAAEEQDGVVAEKSSSSAFVEMAEAANMNGRNALV
jgi:hypothetical protein